MNATIREIARKAGFETLETRKSDSLDFQDMAVWTFREALEAAYAAGQKAASASPAKRTRTRKAR